MKKFYLFCFALASSLLLFSCKDDTKEEPSLVPLKSITVTSGDETVTGAINDEAKSVNFVFNNCEEFTSVTIVPELYDGWILTYPTTLEGVDLQNTPILNFTSPDNRVVKYNVTFSSNAFPIVDPAKIQIEGLDAGANVTVDNAAKVITITYDRDLMDLEAVKLIFNEGALQEGTTVPEDLTFNFAESNTYTLVLNLGGERPYTLKVDVSAYISKSLNEFGFQDVTADYGLTDAQKEIVTVYKTTGISDIPVSVREGGDSPYEYYTRYDNSYGWHNYYIASLYGVANPRNWECINQEWTAYGDTYYEDDIFSFPGDWKADRPTMNCFGNLYIVLLDRAAVKAELTSGANGVLISSADGIVTTTGWNTDESECNYRVWDEGNVVRTGHADLTYRAAVGIDADGRLDFETATTSLTKVPFQETTPDAAALAAASTEAWNVKDAAWVAGWGVRDGKALKIWDILNNDCTQYASDLGVLGMGWDYNFYFEHNLLGYTYDGKIALMINEEGVCNWDGSTTYVDVDNNWEYFAAKGINYRGYSLKQMFWLAQKLGWIDAAVLGNRTDVSKMRPVVYVNGKSLTGLTDDYTTAYTLSFNAR